MREIRHYLSVVLVLLCAPALLAQPMEFARGQKVLLRPSTSALKLDDAARGIRFVADVAVSDAGVTINGASDWPGAAMPDFKEMEIRRMAPAKSGGYEVELRREGSSITTVLRFADEASAAKALPQLLIRAGDTVAVDAWTEHVNAAMAEKMFKGPLAKIPAESRKALLELENKQRLGHFTGETFKEHDYLQINTGESENVYNTLKMNRSQRMARGAAELLPVLKAVHRALGNCTAIYGIKVTTLVPYKNFVTEGDSGSDRIAIYAPCESVAKFANADISGQKLLDESIILVNGDRSEVSLSAE
jgi:hypothetical protein